MFLNWIVCIKKICIKKTINKNINKNNKSNKKNNNKKKNKKNKDVEIQKKVIKMQKILLYGMPKNLAAVQMFTWKKRATAMARHKKRI